MAIRRRRRSVSVNDIISLQDSHYKHSLFSQYWMLRGIKYGNDQRCFEMAKAHQEMSRTIFNKMQINRRFL